MASLDRRAFLGATGAVVAGHILAGKISAKSPNGTINVGCIGVGVRGGPLLNGLVEFPGLAVRAICDIDAEHLAKAQKVVVDAGQPKPAGTAEWKKMLEMKDVDVVVAALPCDLHAACYLDVLAAGKDLYGEKPMCLTMADCDAVVAATKKNNRIVQIGFQRRSNPCFIDSVKAVHDGEIGDLIEGRIHWSNSWGPLYGWCGLRQRSGDWMVEQAVHNIDVINWASRSLPVRAVGLGNNTLFREKQPERNVHDYYSAVVEYDDGLIVNIIHSWISPNKFNTEHTRLIGTKGGVDFGSGTVSYRPELHKPDRVGNYPRDFDDTQAALNNFVKALRTRQQPVSTVEHGRNAVLTALMVRQAVDTKKAVEVKDLTA